MWNRIARLAAVGSLLLLGTGVCGAIVWEVELESGHMFRTRYEPVDASFDTETLMFLSDAGNWVAIPKADVTRVVTQTEVLGYGTVLDGVTIQIGQLPNDKPTPDEEAELAAQSGQRGTQPSNFSMPLLGEPNAGAGIPLNFLNVNTPPLGGQVFGGAPADARRGGGGGADARRFGGGPFIAEPSAREF